MKKLISLFLAALLVLCACGRTEEPVPTYAPTEAPATPTPALVSGGEDSHPMTNSEVLAALGCDEAAALAALRRAVVQDFDRAYLDCSYDEEFFDAYYSGVGGGLSALCRRAAALRSLRLDEVELHVVDGGCCCLLPDGRELRLDLDSALLPTCTVSDEVVTAELKHGEVTLTFADSEQAAYYLYDYSDDYETGRDYSLPCDELRLATAYAVQGCFSVYTDLFLGVVGESYRPYLFLVTDQGGLEFVDILGCARIGVFCAMPIPGAFDGSSLTASTAGDPEDGFAYQTVLATHADGQSVDLADCIFRTQWSAVPNWAWSGSVDEVRTEGGSYSVMAYLDFSDWEYFSCTVSELDAVVREYNGFAVGLGMTEDGVVCSYQAWPPEGGSLIEGAFVYARESAQDALELKVLTGESPYGSEGTWVELLRVENAAYDLT